MQNKKFSMRLMLAAFALLGLVALAACGSPAASKPTSPSRSAPAVVPSNPPAAPSSPPAAQPTAPAGEATKPGGEGVGKPEAGSSLPSVTDPGGLPPSAAQTNSQTGQEKMVVYRDPQKRYQVLFVSGWTTGAGGAPGSVQSTSQDHSVQIAIANSGGKNALAFATADEANVKTTVSGYQQLALKPGQIPSGSVTSLIYRYQAGQNPVTGKPLEHIAARVYVPRLGSNDMAIITVTAPATAYGDLTQIFDQIVASFKWM